MDSGTPHPGRRARVFIYGRVQGVGFRWSACREAEKLGLRGWVRNRPDGSVEILAEGESLDRFLDWCARGPMMARVDRTTVFWEEVTDRTALEGFTIRPDGD